MDFRAFVKELVVSNRYERLAEIGVWKGDLSRILWALPSTKFLLLVDPFDAESTGMTEFRSQGELDEMFRVLNLARPKHVEMTRLRSIDAARTIEDGFLDFVFIDALHTYEAVVEDIRAWRPKVRKGGMLAGDDYSGRFPGVQQAVTELLPNHAHVGRVWLDLQ